MTDQRDDAVDKIIRQAMDDGKFDNLPGQGKPFPKDENPFEDPGKWAANRMLKAAGFALPWMEERKELEADMISARASLMRSWLWRCDAPPGELADAQWRQAMERFREKVTDLNRRILNYNLKAPAVNFHIPAMDAETEIAQVRRSSSE